MTKQIKQDELAQEEASTETTQTSDEAHKEKSHTFRNFFFLISFLLIVIGISYYLTPLLLPYLSESSAIKQDEIISVATPDPVRQLPLSENLQPTFQPTVIQDELNVPEDTQENTSTPSSTNDNTITEQPALTPEQPVAQVLPEVNSNIVNTPPLDNLRPTKPITRSSTQSTLLMKVIQLRETFQQNGQCRPLLEELIIFSELHPVIQNSVNELLMICLDSPMSEQIQSAFYKSKKRAILRILQNSNTPMMAYVKALPYIVFDIRKKEAFEDTPMDILYRLQTAVEANQFAQIIELINQLPNNVQSTLHDLKQCAMHENTIYQVLQNLIQTLATGGNNE